MLNLNDYEAFQFYRTFLHWYCTWAKPTYLEIGCASGEMTATLPTESAMGIDVVRHVDWATYEHRYPHVNYVEATSDEYFKRLHESVKFGLIFIDGDHSEGQVYRDVVNSLQVLEPAGLIVMHDTCPDYEELTHEDRCGTAYKAVQRLRLEWPELQVFTFPVTYGVTLVNRKGQGFQW